MVGFNSDELHIFPEQFQLKWGCVGFFWWGMGRLFWTDNICENETVSRPVVWDSSTAWSVALQVSVSMGFSRENIGVDFLLQGIFQIPGIKLGLLHCRQESLEAGSTRCSLGLTQPGCTSPGWAADLLGRAGHSPRLPASCGSVNYARKGGPASASPADSLLFEPPVGRNKFKQKKKKKKNTVWPLALKLTSW